MDSQSKLLQEISVPTLRLKIETIQEILFKAKEYYKCEKNRNDNWSQVAQILWSHLQTGLKTMDDQLLCATCFFTVLKLIDNIDSHITDLLKYIGEESIIRQQNEMSSKTSQVVSLMYGMFQSSFLIQNTEMEILNFVTVLQRTVELLILMGYEYTQHTFLVFKILKSLKKTIGTKFQEHIYNKENINRLLNLVNHNWENPITGVRDLNRSIFQTLVTLLDNDMYEEILNEINGFYWNKAKYLMLSEIIEYIRGDIISNTRLNKWVEGLVKSLKKPGLVSAGADMYYALLKKIKTEDDWCKIFLSQIITIFDAKNDKAIENFSNYWCLTTMKKFPMITHNIMDELKKMNDSEHKLYSTLCVLKQANKLGIIDKKWSIAGDYDKTERAVVYGIEHCNNYIRMLAFEIVCVSQGKSVPSSIEYDLILNFLHNNVNSDCTVLRLNMLNSLNIFLIQLHSTFLNNIIKNCNETDIENLLDFCKRLQDFIIKSLNLKGNYQRKITSVKLCELVIRCSSEVPRKKKAQTRQVNITLVEYLKEKHVWLFSEQKFVMKLISLLKDPADDVRESVINLLLNHFSSELSNALIDSIIVDALTCMKSKFFYEISCGQSMFKFIANILLRKKQLNVRFGRIEDIFLFGYKELVTEYKLNREIMNSIDMGKQLHSFMSILLVVLEVCTINSYKMDTSDATMELLDVLEGISNQFSWEQDTSTSSDFSKMSDMVQNIIANSGYNPKDDDDQAKISGLQQIVLNSLWLNVKASCDVASVLIKFNTNDAIVSEKCLNIITHVLETSRHKGAIEAAGVALGKAIQCLTSLPEETGASKVPYVLLQCKLQDLISETNKMSSITRRGAGLSIMVHRIVSSDMKKGKPLFHYFMNTLLEVCKKTEEIPMISVNDGNMENQVDLPKAIYIHFMTRIVTDSSLASDLMYYSAQLGEIAFGNLISTQWQIRNAALQLYGALVPRLIGQKKASGNDDETIATVAYDELRTHCPKLWTYITEQLNRIDVVDRIQCHSNLVPILNILASTAQRYNFLFDTREQNTADEKLLLCLFGLLGSPIYTVRRLVAKCIFNIYEFDCIYNTMLKKECVSENYLHGSLILLRLCHKYYSLEENCRERIYNLKEFFCNKLNSNQHSYLCKEHFEDVYINYFSINDIESTLSELNNNIHMPGVFVWAETRLRKYINSCPWREIPDLLQIILLQSDFEKYCKLVLIKIELENNIPAEELAQIVNILITFEGKFSSNVIWRILYELSKKIDLHLDIPLLLNILDDNKMIYRLRYMIPLIARNIANSLDTDKSRLVELISKLSDFENSDVDLRYIAALANNELANHFEYLSDGSKIVSVTCAIMLLQDEDEDVRNLSVNFYKNVCKETAEVHANICLNNIINNEFLNAVLSNPKTAIPELSNKLTEILNSNHTVDEYNPFSNDSKNIFLEQEVLKALIENLNV